MIIDEKQKAIAVVDAMFDIDIKANWKSRKAIYVLARRLITVWLLYHSYTVVEIGYIMERDHSTICTASATHCNYMTAGDKYSRLYAVAFAHFMALMQGREVKESMSAEQYKELIYKKRYRGKNRKGLSVSC